MCVGAGAGRVALGDSSSSSNNNSSQVARGEVDTGDSSDESDPDLKSNACKHLPPAAVDDSWLDTTSTTPNQMSSGRGTPTDGAGWAVVVLASPASSSLPESSARDSAADFSARRKSIAPPLCWKALRPVADREFAVRLCYEGHRTHDEGEGCT